MAFRFLFTLILLAPASALADAYATSQQSARATGHYARARALLIEALGEFSQAKSIASPDLLINSEDWELSVISRAEELNRVLDPQPRVSRDGVRFNARGLHIQHASSRTPKPRNSAHSNNYSGEDARKQREILRRLSIDSENPNKKAEEAKRVETPKVDRAEKQKEIESRVARLQESIQPEPKEVEDEPVFEEDTESVFVPEEELEPEFIELEEIEVVEVEKQDLKASSNSIELEKKGVVEEKAPKPEEQKELSTFEKAMKNKSENRINQIVKEKN